MVKPGGSPRVIMPESVHKAAESLRMSPAILSGNHLFLGGVTGGDAQGRMPDDPEQQMRQAFDKIAMVLSEAGLSFRSVAEMTSFHIGLRAHFEMFDRVRLDFVHAPYPAWTAVEVAGLRREGAVVEIRMMAQAPTPVDPSGTIG